MPMNPSNELKSFIAQRDEALQGLTKCAQVLMPGQLEKAGFVCTRSAYFDDEDDEYEFHEFEKHGKKLVFNQVYVEKEGGLYFQSLFSEDGQLPDLDTAGEP